MVMHDGLSKRGTTCSLEDLRNSYMEVTFLGTLICCFLLYFIDRNDTTQITEKEQGSSCKSVAGDLFTCSINANELVA